MTVSSIEKSLSYYTGNLCRGKRYSIDIRSKKNDAPSIDIPLNQEEIFTKEAKDFIKDFEKELKSLSGDTKNILKEDLEERYYHKKHYIINLLLGTTSLILSQILFPKSIIDVNEPYKISSSFSSQSFVQLICSIPLSGVGINMFKLAWDNHSNIKKLNNDIKIKELHIQASQMGKVLLGHIERIEDDNDKPFFNGKICSGNELIFLQNMCKHLYDNRDNLDNLDYRDYGFGVEILNQILALKKKDIITKNDIIKIFATSVKDSNVATIKRLKDSAKDILCKMEASSSGNAHHTP